MPASLAYSSLSLLLLSLLFGLLNPLLFLLTLYSSPLQLLTIITWEPNPFLVGPIITPLFGNLDPNLLRLSLVYALQISSFLLHATQASFYTSCFASPPGPILAWTVGRVLEILDLGVPESRA